MTSVPIACTLAAEGRVDRMEEWKNLLATKILRVERQENNATLMLLTGTDVLLAVIDLAEREKACCPFFEFSVELDETGARLCIEVPIEAEPILAELLSLVSARIPPG